MIDNIQLIRSRHGMYIFFLCDPNGRQFWVLINVASSVIGTFVLKKMI